MVKAEASSDELDRMVERRELRLPIINPNAH
jgi:hypothetical protein